MKKHLTIETIDQKIAELEARRKIKMRDLRQREAMWNRKTATSVGGHLLRLAVTDPRARAVLTDIAIMLPPEFQRTISALYETRDA